MPPWDSAIWRTMARPRPARRWPVEAQRRAAGVGRSGRSGRRPGRRPRRRYRDLRRGRRSRPSRCGSHSQDNSLPPRASRTAFESRLSTARRSAERSPAAVGPGDSRRTRWSSRSAASSRYSSAASPAIAARSTSASTNAGEERRADASRSSTSRVIRWIARLTIAVAWARSSGGCRHAPVLRRRSPGSPPAGCGARGRRRRQLPLGDEGGLEPAEHVVDGVGQGASARPAVRPARSGGTGRSPRCPAPSW